MIKYRAEIDGLRTIAVIPVILFHLGYSWVNGGYFGVDVFFVISGYLITSIIFKEITSGTFSMKEFWIRRVKRILPAVIAVVIATLTVAPFLIFKGDIISITSDALSALFSYANFHLLSKFGDYWGSSAEGSFFLHAWSLSVEEQFYIFYPLFLLILYKFRLSLPKWLSLITFFSLLAFIVGSIYYPTSTFYLLPTRAWEMASGGLLAVLNYNKKVSDDKSGNYKSILAGIGLILILSSYFVFTGEDGVNIFAILPVLGTVMIIAFSSRSNIIGKLLSSKPLVYIGKISYSLYLWHWPVIVLLRNYYVTKLSSVEIQFIAIISTAVLSILSYYFVENKTRKWKHTPKFVLASIVIIVGYIFLLQSPLVNKEYKSPFNKVVFYGLYYDITPKIWAVSEANKIKRIGIVAPERNNAYSESYKNNGIITSQGIKSDPQIVVLGDSHGAMWAKVIDEIAENDKFKTSFYTSVGSTPFFNISPIEKQDGTRGFTKEQRVAYAKGFMDNLKIWKPRLLIISSKWDSMNEAKMRNLDSLLNVVQSIGIKVLILNQPPVIDVIGDKNTAQYLTFLGYAPNAKNQYIADKSDIGIVNQKLEQHLSKYSNISLFDAYSTFAQESDKALIIKNNDVLYYDDDHLSYQGTLLVKDQLSKTIKILMSETQ